MRLKFLPNYLVVLKQYQEGQVPSTYYVCHGIRVFPLWPSCAEVAPEGLSSLEMVKKDGMWMKFLPHGLTETSSNESSFGRSTKKTVIKPTLRSSLGNNGPWEKIILVRLL